MRNGRTRAGFTLAEVIVALAIAAGALILVVSAGHESLRRSLRADESARLGHACESKLAEIACGVEPGGTGDLAGMPGWSWRIERETFGIKGLEGLDRVTFHAIGPGSSNEAARTLVLCLRAARRP